MIPQFYHPFTQSYLSVLFLLLSHQYFKSILCARHLKYTDSTPQGALCSETKPYSVVGLHQINSGVGTVLV